MLKIIDDYDLKGLEKFGYLDMGNCYQKYDNWGIVLFIDKETRKIERVHPYSTISIPNDDEIVDLSKAGIVEKVEE